MAVLMEKFHKLLHKLSFKNGYKKLENNKDQNMESKKDHQSKGYHRCKRRHNLPIYTGKEISLRGYIPIYVGKERKRYLVPVDVVNTSDFKTMLEVYEIAPLEVSCSPQVFENVLRCAIAKAAS